MRIDAERLAQLYNDYAQTHLASDNKRHLAELFLEFLHAHWPVRSSEIVVLRRLVNRLGEALNEQHERWGLYGNESHDALTEFKRFTARHNAEISERRK